MSILADEDDDYGDEAPYTRRDDWECETCGDTGWVGGAPCPDCGDDE